MSACESVLQNVMSISEEETLLNFLLERLLGFENLLQEASFSQVRLTHIYSLFVSYNRKFSECKLDMTFLYLLQQCMNEEYLCKFMNETFPFNINTDDDEELNKKCVSIIRGLKFLGKKKFIKLFKSIEKDTRGQAKNPVWHALRYSSLTATKIYEIYMTKSLPMNDRKFVSEAAMFGIQHEEIIKKSLSFYFMKKNEMLTNGLGILLDPNSAVLGASVDACYGINITEDNFITVENKVRIFEIKARHKYLREKTDIYVQNLLTECTEEAFAKFILSHSIPSIEFRRTGNVPSAKEYLITHNPLYQLPKKFRSCTTPEVLKSDIQKLISLNETQKSTVLIFDCKENTETKQLSLFEKCRFTTDVFINPKHRYFFQCLTQQYIVSQYYIYDHIDPEKIDFTNLPTVSIVSAFFIKKTNNYPIYINDQAFLDEQIPLCLIITPIVFDPYFSAFVIKDVLNIWNNNIKQKTNLQLWVENGANTFVASSIPRPKTP